jgi:starch-binding outer membrane protein, SusD/RagB family
MMKRYLNVALTLGLAAGVAGCDDDFLTTVPQDVISDAVYWETERDFTLAINGAYREVLDTDQFYMEGASDLSYSGKDWTANHAYAQGHQDALTGWSNGIWARLYRGITRANEVLTQLETSEASLSPTARTQLEAQARFLRGYFYHELLWLYGGVPIFTQVPTITEAREVSRSSRDEVIDFVLADLTAAANGLPESWPAASYGRATKGAALAFKARAALYEGSWQKYQEGNAARATTLFQTAAEAAQAVMALGVYELYPNFRDLFTYAGEGSKEVIFDYQRLKGVNGWSSWTWFAPHSMGANIDLAPTRAVVDAFRMEDGLPISESPMYDESPPVIQNGAVVSLGMYADRDPRFYATVLFPGGTFNGAVYNSFPDSPTPDKLIFSNFSNSHTGFVWLKYVDPADQADPFNSGLNIIRMRYADILLMYAEAKIELNQIDATVEAALNEIRDRAGMPDVALGSQAAMIELVRNERVAELAGEGLRLADIRRWKIAEEVMPGPVAGIDIREGGEIVTLSGLWQRSFPAPRNYLWPIPAPERDLNPNMAQNPGY